jgi:hypothetical protein
MTLGGRIELAGSGFVGDSERRVDAKADLDGRLGTGPRQALNLHLDGGWSASRDAAAQRVTVRDLKLAQGGSRASAEGSWARSNAAAPWHAQGRLALADFDPGPWLPTLPGLQSARQANRLNAAADLDLLWRADAAPATLDGWLAALQGKAEVRITDSRLAGVPLGGHASFRGDAGATAAAALDLEVAGNTVKAQGRLGSDGANRKSDHWSGSIDAPALQRLQPLWQAIAGEAQAVSGAVRGQFQLDGRWPTLPRAASCTPKACARQPRRCAWRGHAGASAPPGTLRWR